MKGLGQLLARASTEEVETQHDAVGRILQVVGDDNAPAADRGAAVTALYRLLCGPRLGVVSKACQGLIQLLERSSKPGVDIGKTQDALLEAVNANLEGLRQQSGHRAHEARALTRTLVRCLVGATRAAGRTSGQAEKHGCTAALLAMDRGVLFPALSQEATGFLRGSGVEPGGALSVIGPLLAVVLLQPEYVNFRGDMLLKLSTSSAFAPDPVKLCLIVFQAELLTFSATHTAAHADVAASWCASLANAIVSLDTIASWDRASRTVVRTALYLLGDFQGRGFPAAPLLAPLRLLAEAGGAGCFADELAYLGITALQSPCLDEREAVLDIIGRTACAMPLGSGDTRAQTWTLQALVYPVVGMAASGNSDAALMLPSLEAALARADELARAEGVEPTTTQGGVAAGSTPPQFLTAVALGVRRLSSAGCDEQSLVSSCAVLQRRANALKEASFQDRGREQASRVSRGLERVFCVLAPILLRPRCRKAHDAACAALVSLVRAAPALGVRLLPFVLYVIRALRGAGTAAHGVLSLLKVIPELGAHKLAAKPVAGILQALASAPQGTVRAVGLRLATRLIQVNPRTFDMLQLLLTKTSPDHVPPSPPEPEQIRLCRMAGMLDLCSTEPELGLECVRPIQAFLADESGAIVSLALRAIAALIGADCLDFDAALRIVTKKGKVAHMSVEGGEGGAPQGDPRVLESLALVCAAGAEAATLAAADASAEESEDSDGRSTPEWDMAKAVELLLQQSVPPHPVETVRVALYAALRVHLPALLEAGTGQEPSEGAAGFVSRIRAVLGNAMYCESRGEARRQLEAALKIVLTSESNDPSTWVASKRAGASRGARGESGGRTGPSKRLIAALPDPASILEAFRRDESDCPGLAGAALWASSERGAKSEDRLEAMIRDLGELLVAEGRGGGLAPCPWKRAATPLAIQRFVRGLLSACQASEISGSGGAAASSMKAIETCRRAIEELSGVSRGLVALASSSLASCVPSDHSYVPVEEVDRAVDRLRNLERAQPLLDGEHMYPLCAAMAARAVPEADAAKVEACLRAVEDIMRAEAGEDVGSTPAADACIIDSGNEPLLFWSRMSIGVTAEWSARHPNAPEAKSVVIKAVRRLLLDLAETTRSNEVAALCEAWFGRARLSEGVEGSPVLVTCDGIRLGLLVAEAGADIGNPTSRKGSRCFALFLGLASALTGLRATGLHEELLQVFHVVTAFQEAGVCGAALCLPTASSHCLSCGLIDSSIVHDRLRSLSRALDTKVATHPGPQRLAEDIFVGAAGLVAVCDSAAVILPAGFAESMFERLRAAAVYTKGAPTGIRVAALVGLAWMVGCPLLGLGEFVPRRMRVSSLVSRRMVELLLGTVDTAIAGTSIRPKNVAALVKGILSAVGKDEQSSTDSGFEHELDWTGVSAHSGPTRSVKRDALCVAREGTLMSIALTGLQSIAVDNDEEGFIKKLGGATSEAVVKQQSSLFMATVMSCLQACPDVRVPHEQMAAVIEVIFKSGRGPELEMRCISLALALAGKQQAYSAWLAGLYRKTLFTNLFSKTRQHLLSLLAQVASNLSAGMVRGVVQDMWASLSLRMSTYVPGATRAIGTSSAKDDDASNMASFLAALAVLAKSHPVGDVIRAVTIETILPEVLRDAAFVGDPSSFKGEGWNSLVELLAYLPRASIQHRLSLGSSERAAFEKPEDDTVKAYLAARLSGSSGEGLRSVARWVTDRRTSEASSAAVLPHLAEGFARADTTSRGSCLRMLLERVGLPESRPARAIAAVGGAAALWDDRSEDGFLALGVLGGDFLRRATDHTSAGDAALLYAMSTAGPRCVARMEDSEVVSVEVLSRLLRLSTLLRAGDVVSQNSQRREVETTRLGVEAFIRGMRHSPPVVNGSIAKQFTSFAESVAVENALSSIVET